MSIKRQGNFLGQMRLDVPDLRSIESAITNDFDDLAGRVLAGKIPLVVKGFSVSVDNIIGAKATTLQLNVAGGVILHYGASESGTVFTVDDNAAAEVLSQSNPNILGYFVNSARNYIGIDLYRSADSSTIDTKQFLDSTTLTEVAQDVPLARTLKYKIVISTQNFSSASNILPIAIVSLDSSGAVTNITDSRRMMFGLASGGDAPSISNKYSWGARTTSAPTYNTNGGTNPFNNEEKNFGSIKGWMDAIMTSLWELRGGDSWYANQLRDNVKVAYSPSVLSNADNVWLLHGFTVPGTITKTGNIVTVNWGSSAASALPIGSVFSISYNPADAANFSSGIFSVISNSGTSFTYTDTFSVSGTQTASIAPTINDTLAIRGINVIFENSGGSISTAPYYNAIQDIALVVPDKYCVYIDIDRSQNTFAVPVAVPLNNIGTSALPGRRLIFAWRVGASAYIRDRGFEVGRTIAAATTLALGITKLNYTPGTPSSPIVPTLGSNNGITLGTATGYNIASGFGLTIAASGTGQAASLTNSHAANPTINIQNSAGPAFLITSTNQSSMFGAMLITNSTLYNALSITHTVAGVRGLNVNTSETGGWSIAANGFSNTGSGTALIASSTGGPGLMVATNGTNKDGLVVYNGDVKLFGASGETRLIYKGNSDFDGTAPTKYIHTIISDAAYSLSEWQVGGFSAATDPFIQATSNGVWATFKIPAPQGMTITGIELFYNLGASVNVNINYNIYRVIVGGTSRGGTPFGTGTINTNALSTGDKLQALSLTSFDAPINGFVKVNIQISGTSGTDYTHILLYGLRITGTMNQLTGVMS